MSTGTVNSFLTWSPPNKAVLVRLEYSAMERMNFEVMRGFGVTRRRGTETGGVLLGRIDRKSEPPTIHIHDFEVVPCEYASGPSYVLSAKDQQAFRETVSRWQPSLDRDSYAVGFFRSHTRDGFALDEKDAAVVREFFPDLLDVVLLLKPFATRAPSAGFFLKDKGTLVTAATPQEFSFTVPDRNSGAIMAAPASAPVAPPAAKPPTVDPSPVAAPAPPPPPPSPAPKRAKVFPETRTERAPERSLFAEHTKPPSPWGARLAWVALGLALLAFGAACGYEYAGAQSKKALEAMTASATAPAGETGQGLPGSNLYNMSLQVLPVEGSLLVRWNRNAPPIQSALRGVLTVTEGANSKEVPLGFAELRNGTAMYPNTSPNVRFRLEVFFRENRSLAETVDYRGTQAQ